MKKFLFNLLFFGLIFLLVNGAAFFVLSKPTILKDYILSKKMLTKYRNFMVADSHGKAVRQLDLANVQICNFSYDSDSYFDMLVKVDYLIKNYKVDTLYLTVDDHTLSQYRERWTNRERSIYYSSFELQNKFYRMSLPEFLYKKYVGFYLPLFTTKNTKIFSKYIESRITRNELPNYENYDFSKVSTSVRLRRSKDRVKSQYPSGNSSEFLKDCLEEIIHLCQQKNIEIIGIKYPLTHEFIDELGDNSFHADQFLKENGYKVIDLKKSFANQISYFRDQDHLNYAGSKNFIYLMKKLL